MQYQENTLDHVILLRSALRCLPSVYIQNSSWSFMMWPFMKWAQRLFQIQVFNILRCCASASLACFAHWACLCSLITQWPLDPTFLCCHSHCCTTMPSPHLRSALFSSDCLLPLAFVAFGSVYNVISLRRFDPLRLLLSSWLVCPVCSLEPCAGLWRCDFWYVPPCD